MEQQSFCLLPNGDCDDWVHSSDFEVRSFICIGLLLSGKGALSLA